MLAASPHPWKVNFCKFTNETRNGIEDASANSGQTWLAALNGTASGGGYELALACEHIMLIDDRSSAVSLPELPLLGVLPGTGGLTRVVDKRHVRRDRADYFSTKSEGLGGKKAVAWRLVDEAVPRAKWDEVVRQRAGELAARSSRPADADGAGIELAPLAKTRTDEEISYDHVTARLDPARGVAEITVSGPDTRAAGQPGRAARAGRQLLDPGRHPGTGRPDPGPAHQRAGAGYLGAAHPGRPGPGAGLRPVPGRPPRRLAGRRDRALPEAHPQAAGRDQPQPAGPDRAGQLLRGLAARARAGRGPLLHAVRRVRGGRPGRPARPRSRSAR